MEVVETDEDNHLSVVYITNSIAAVAPSTAGTTSLVDPFFTQLQWCVE